MKPVHRHSAYSASAAPFVKSGPDLVALLVWHALLGAAVVAACNAGSYNTSAGTCAPCPPGTYCRSTGLTAPLMLNESCAEGCVQLRYFSFTSSFEGL